MVCRHLLAVLLLQFVVQSLGQNVNPISTGIDTDNLFWDPRALYLYFTDRANFTVSRYDPNSGQLVNVTLYQQTTFIIPTQDGIEGFYFLGGLDRDASFLYLDFQQGGFNFFNCLVARVDRGCQGNNFAAVKADAYGRIWAGTSSAQNTQDEFIPYGSSFYRIDITEPGVAEVDIVISGLTNPAGLTWSPDNLKMYLTNYLSRSILAYDFNLAQGTICNPREVFSFDAANITGTPGGMTVDNFGHLWLAVTGAGMVINVNPFTGEVLYAFAVPATNVTDVEWGGSFLDTLYVSSRMSPGNTTEQNAGSVFEVTNINVPGYDNVVGIPRHFAKLNSHCRPVYSSPIYYDNIKGV